MAFKNLALSYQGALQYYREENWQSALEVIERELRLPASLSEAIGILRVLVGRNGTELTRSIMRLRGFCIRKVLSPGERFNQYVSAEGDPQRERLIASAAQHAQLCLEVFGDDPDELTHAATVASLVHEDSLAQKMLHRALELDSNHESARFTLDTLYDDFPPGLMERFLEPEHAPSPKVRVVPSPLGGLRVAFRRLLRGGRTRRARKRLLSSNEADNRMAKTWIGETVNDLCLMEPLYEDFSAEERLDSPEELAVLRKQLKRTELLPIFDEGQTTCCYATSDKSWTQDPTGIAWETYHTMAEAELFSAPSNGGDPACCAPGVATGDNVKAGCC